MKLIITYLVLFLTLLIYGQIYIDQAQYESQDEPKHLESENSAIMLEEYCGRCQLFL